MPLRSLPDLPAISIQRLFAAGDHQVREAERSVELTGNM